MTTPRPMEVRFEFKRVQAGAIMYGKTKEEAVDKWTETAMTFEKHGASPEVRAEYDHQHQRWSAYLTWTNVHVVAIKE